MLKFKNLTLKCFRVIFALKSKLSIFHLPLFFFSTKKNHKIVRFSQNDRKTLFKFMTSQMVVMTLFFKVIMM